MIEEALKQYIQAQSWQLEGITQAQASLDHGEGITFDAAMEEMDAHIGRPGRIPGTRELAIPGTASIASYQVSGDQLQILRVYHGARQWPDHFDE